MPFIGEDDSIPLSVSFAREDETRSVRDIFLKQRFFRVMRILHVAQPVMQMAINFAKREWLQVRSVKLGWVKVG